MRQRTPNGCHSEHFPYVIPSDSEESCIPPCHSERQRLEESRTANVILTVFALSFRAIARNLSIDYTQPRVRDSSFRVSDTPFRMTKKTLGAAFFDSFLWHKRNEQLTLFKKNKYTRDFSPGKRKGEKL